MGVIIGWMVGYVMGTKAGEEGLEELKKSWTTIRQSEEAQRMVSGGFAMGKSLLSRGGGMIVERLGTKLGLSGGHSDGGSVSTLRPTG